MPDIAYVLLPLVGVFAFAAGLLAICDLVGRYLKFQGLAMYLLMGVGLLLSGIGWEGYAHGRVTFWQALGGSVILGGLPFWFAAPDILYALFRAAANRLRKRVPRA